MSTFITVVLLIVGLVLIIKGGDFFVDAASWMAEVSGIPKVIVGATVVSLATTLPELLVSAFAAGKGQVDMAIGNAVGSVTANTGLIFAIGIICMPAVIKRADYMFKGIAMVAVMAILVIFAQQRQLSPVVCVIILVVFVLFVIENVRGARKSLKEDPEVKEDVPKDKKTIIINILKFAFGAAGIIIGADLLVDNGSELARIIGVSERVIAVTFVAIGTSLPELVTTITAIVKKQSALSVGNILGANIIDLTLILPISSIISGKALPVSATAAILDIPACLVVGIIAVVPTLITKKFRRSQGIIMLVLYIGYLVATVMM